MSKRIRKAFAVPELAVLPCRQREVYGTKGEPLELVKFNSNLRTVSFGWIERRATHLLKQCSTLF